MNYKHVGSNFDDFLQGEQLLGDAEATALKRVKPLRVTEVVANAPEENPPLTLDEIDEIVHAVRQQHRQG